MVANILIAIGFFFAGAAFGTRKCIKELYKARKDMFTVIKIDHED